MLSVSPAIAFLPGSDYTTRESPVQRRNSALEGATLVEVRPPRALSPAVDRVDTRGLLPFQDGDEHRQGMARVKQEAENCPART